MRASFYRRWQARLNGEAVTTFTEPDEGDCGMYRLPILERKKDAKGNNNGQWRHIGWKPVALYVEKDELVCLIGADRSDFSSWPSFSQHPISDEWYRAVAQRGEPWPDDEIPAADRVVEIGDNDPPEEDSPEAHAIKIDMAIGAAPKTVKSAEDAALAAGSMNRIAELRLACDKAGKAVYKPLYDEYIAKQKAWSKPVKNAVDAEKSILTSINAWREAERKRLAKEAEEAAAKLDIAIDPQPVAAPAPIAPTYGGGNRKIKAEPQIFAVITDYIAVLAHFKDDPVIVDRVQKLATDAARAKQHVLGMEAEERFL